MCAIFLFSACMYFSKYEMVSSFYGMFGFPIWMIYPLAGLKILGVVAILTRFSPLLKEWAYAGFFFDSLAAFSAHQVAHDGGAGLAAVALLAAIASRYFESRLHKDSPKLI
jgi:hypothetical protein